MQDRREFIKTLAAITGSLSMTATLHAEGSKTSDRLGELLPQRILGRTGEAVTMLGLGGAHVSAQFSDSDAEKLIEASIEGGIRFFDTASIYSGGESEKRYGRYLTPKYRDIVFLMTKSNGGEYDGTTADSVRKHLDDSLRNMKTDYIDLWQMHQIMSPEDVNNRINKGVLDVLLEAKEAGKVRYIGFSGHSDPAAHQLLLDTTDIFETCQMPVNCADPSYGSFIRKIMPQLVQRNIGIIAMKTLACGGFFGGDTWFQGGNKPKIVPDCMTITEAIHFVWSLPVSVIVTGPNNIAQLQEKIDLARSFVDMSAEKRDQLIAKASSLTPDKGVEFYKKFGLPVEHGPLAVPDWNLHG